MRAYVRLSAIAAGVALLLSVPMAARQSSRPSVALLDFDFSSVEHWWSGNQDIGKGIADLIVDELVDDGSFRVFERKKLDAILGEQNFNASDRVDPSAKAAKIGKAVGVKYLIAGSITEVRHRGHQQGRQRRRIRQQVRPGQGRHQVRQGRGGRHAPRPRHVHR